MITQIKGKLVEKNPTQVVVDCNGIGYEINISLYTFSSLSSDENIKLFTHLQVREDAHILYGFYNFGKSRIQTSNLCFGHRNQYCEDHAFLSYTRRNPTGHWHRGYRYHSGVKGIGLKTAQRLIIELKDKIKSLQGTDEIPVFKSNTIKEETLSALEVLGYSRKASAKVVDKLVQGEPDSSVEELIKSALNKL